MAKADWQSKVAPCLLHRLCAYPTDCVYVHAVRACVRKERLVFADVSVCATMACAFVSTKPTQPIQHINVIQAYGRR